MLWSQVCSAGGSAKETGEEPAGKRVPSLSQGTWETGRVMVQNCPSRRIRA